MEVRSLRIDGLKLFKPIVFHDDRGYFFESYKEPLFTSLGLPCFVQDNSSFSKQNVIRGLHYQDVPGQAKLISCSRGKIFDVAVDLRPFSKTFGQWEAVILDESNPSFFFIPIGFAHGYCALSETALVHYRVSSLYDAAHEKSIRWNDPDIGIQWPVSEPILSLRDQMSPFLHEVFGESVGYRS